MLVLSRKPGERILIGKDIKITIIRIGPNSVRVGIDAPETTNIVREELCQGGQSLGHDAELNELPRGYRQGMVTS